MGKKYVYAIGLMSGTSLDGLDIAYVKFEANNYANFKILQATTVDYTKEWKHNLTNAITFSNAVLKDLNTSYGVFIGNETLNFIKQHKIENLDFIASHGHTVFHQPKKGITLQIGCGQQIANITKHKVICDFRIQDVALGGQGAPLVPIGDALLFSKYDYCINLGGFANVSFEENNNRIAFDICPVNIVLNYYCRKIGKEYDKDGLIASKGLVNASLLLELNNLKYYKKSAPKSLGLEWVTTTVLPLVESYNLEVPQILATVVEHAAMQIAKIIEGGASFLFTGGGVFNKYLMQRISFLANKKIEMPPEELIEYKEALLFAFLGLLKNNEEINCLKSVTGASKNHSSGVVFYP